MYGLLLMTRAFAVGGTPLDSLPSGSVYPLFSAQLRRRDLDAGEGGAGKA